MAFAKLQWLHDRKPLRTPTEMTSMNSNALIFKSKPSIDVKLFAVHFSSPPCLKKKNPSNTSLFQDSYVISQLPNKDIERPVMRLLLCILPAALCNPDSLLIASATHCCNSQVFFLIHKGFGNTEPLHVFSAHDLNPSWSGSWRHQPLNVNAVQRARWLVVQRAMYSALESFSASWNSFITVEQVVTVWYGPQPISTVIKGTHVHLLLRRKKRVCCRVAQLCKI